MKGCPRCGRMFEGDFSKCPYCNFDFSEIMSKNNVITESEPKYAGFIKRLIAFNLDNILIEIIVSIIYLILSIPYGVILLNIDELNYTDILNTYYLGFGIYFLIFVLYNAILERSGFRGSVGKKIMGIQVVDEFDNSLTFPKALLRNILKIVNILTLGIGFIIAGFGRKQTLSDMILKCYVINEVKFEENLNLDYASGVKRFFAFVLDTIVMTGIVFLISYFSLYFSFYSITLLPIFIPIVLLLYFPLSEASSGSSFGKKFFNIKVVGKDGEKISFMRSLIRYILMYIDTASLGFLNVFVSSRKQTVKDILTKTYVVNR